MAICPHCFTEKPVAASFCHACNRRTSLGLHFMAWVIRVVTIFTVFPLCIWAIYKGIMFLGS